VRNWPVLTIFGRRHQKETRHKLLILATSL